MIRKKTALFILLILFLLAAITGAFASPGSTPVVEIFYLPHPPAEAVVSDVEGVLKKFPNLKIVKYSFEDPKSKKVISKYEIKEHMPVVIFIDAKNEFTVGNRRVLLKNFPKGNAFVPMFEGNWTYGDLESILQSLTGRK